MTYKTHRKFAIFWVYIGALVIYKLNISNINYYLMLIVMLLTGRAGALFPDVDHDWSNVKEKTTTNYIINKVIHLTGGKHRSWQTHSWDICIVFTLFCYISSIVLFRNGLISAVNFELFNIITMGFNLGWMSHLFSDMLTSAGVRITCLSNKKVSFVPRYVKRGKMLIISSSVIGIGTAVLFLNNIYGLFSLQFSLAVLSIGTALMITTLKLGNIKFNTGEEWEAYVYNITKKLNLILGIVALIYPLLSENTIAMGKSITTSIINLISR